MSIGVVLSIAFVLIGVLYTRIFDIHADSADYIVNSTISFVLCWLIAFVLIAPLSLSQVVN